MPALITNSKKRKGEGNELDNVELGNIEEGETGKLTAVGEVRSKNLRWRRLQATYGEAER